CSIIFPFNIRRPRRSTLCPYTTLFRSIQDSFLIDGKTINISGSIGIAMYPEHGKNLQDLLVNADAAMLSSKYQGRNTYSVFNFSSDQHESKSQRKMINDLYSAG